ncbi:MAG TPA: SET domain-containing protein [Verrucomicrobiae bacterium]|nr:SET domain-containing protein [Verrucomicrobiae bacterium]
MSAQIHPDDPYGSASWEPHPESQAQLKQQSEQGPRLRVGSTKAKGRGVFAGMPILAGEIIEAVPVIVIPAEQWQQVEPTVLALYIFNFGPEGEHAAIALGYGSLYNHSYLPNAEYRKSWEERLIRFIALRDIAPGEEITVNYNGTPGDRSPIWFEVSE